MLGNRFIFTIYKLISKNMSVYSNFRYDTVSKLIKLRSIGVVLCLASSLGLTFTFTATSAGAAVKGKSSKTAAEAHLFHTKMLMVGPIYRNQETPLSAHVKSSGKGANLKEMLRQQSGMYEDNNSTSIKAQLKLRKVRSDKQAKNFVGSNSCSPSPMETASLAATGGSTLSASLYYAKQKNTLRPSTYLGANQVTTTLPINPALTTTTTQTGTTTTQAASTTTTTQTASTTTTTQATQLSFVTASDLPIVPTTGAPANLDAVSTVKSGLYDLFLTNGAIHNLGGANFYGSPIHRKTKAPIVSMTSTAYGAGYLLLTANGNIYNYGGAQFYGSPVHKKIRKPLVAIVATPDGKGYWLADANGAIYNYGDAPFCGSLVHVKLKAPLIGIATTPDGKGYWLADANGDVYSFGDAPDLTSPAPVRLPSPIVSIAATPDGKGYWMVSAKGNIYNTGDAKFYGSPIHKHFTRPVVSIAATPDGKGYFVTTAKGQIFNYGDAKFHGSLVHRRLGRKVLVAGLVVQKTPPPPSQPAPPSLGPSPFRADISGYDISNFQCSTPGASTLANNLPKSSPFTIIEAAGWLDNADNPCLKAEVGWATGAEGNSGSPYNLYLFMNSPESSSGIIASADSGPAGNCPSLASNLQAACVAYNYGYNGAEQIFSYASAQGASSNVWWLDVENAQLSKTNYSNFPTNYWSGSTTLNDETIQGAIDALRSNKVTVGIYSTSVQYATITGNYIPSAPQVPLWIAGAPWTSPPYSESGLPNTSALQTWCQGSATYVLPKATYQELFAGGTPWLLQETPGTEVSPYNLDPDFAC